MQSYIKPSTSLVLSQPPHRCFPHTVSWQYLGLEETYPKLAKPHTSTKTQSWTGALTPDTAEYCGPPDPPTLSTQPGYHEQDYRIDSE